MTRPPDPEMRSPAAGNGEANRKNQKQHPKNYAADSSDASAPVVLRHRFMRAGTRFPNDELGRRARSAWAEWKAGLSKKEKGKLFKRAR